ncbi:MAG: hypothetical protein WA633_29300 [Stellaceae bacterium]
MGAIVVKKSDHHIVYKMKIDEYTLGEIVRLLGITDPAERSALISGANAITVLKGPPSSSGGGTTSSSSGGDSTP